MPESTLTPQQEAALRGQAFDEGQPGAILHDFQVVLDHVGTEGVKAGGKYNLLPIESVKALDKHLAQPLNLPLERPQLRSHPYLQGLHLLLRASGLGRVKGKGDKARLYIDPATRESWNELNFTERYFALLEAWLLRSSAEMVGERDSFGGESLLSILSTWRIISQAQPGRSTKEVPLLLSLYRQTYSLALMDLFGLVEVEQPAEPKVPWAPGKITMTPFGEALCALLSTREPDFLDLDEDEEDADDEPATEGSFGALLPLLQPYFPAYQKALTLGSTREERKGVFIFKVSLGRDVWRRIALSDEDNLHTLLSAILKSINFDYDHLYEFTYRDKFGRTVTAGSDELEEGTPAYSVRLGTLPLAVGDSMSLLYDFGDSWRFNVKLEKIEPVGSHKKLPVVLEKHGKAPQQYPDAD